MSDNVAKNNRLWRAGKRAKLNLVAIQLDSFSVLPLPFLYFFRSFWYLGFCIFWMLAIFVVGKFKMTPSQGIKRLRAIIAGNERFITRFSKRRRRFTSGF